MAKFKRIDTGGVVNVVSWGANGTYTDYYNSKKEKGTLEQVIIRWIKTKQYSLSELNKIINNYGKQN